MKIPLFQAIHPAMKESAVPPALLASAAARMR